MLAHDWYGLQTVLLYAISALMAGRHTDDARSALAASDKFHDMPYMFGDIGVNRPSTAPLFSETI
jgi:hypothetical protein